MRPAVAVFLVIASGAFAQELYAQGGAVVAAPRQFQADYAFTSSTGCLHSASASCRRKPRTQLPPGSNTYFSNGAAPMFEPDGASVRVWGDMAAVRIDARRTTIADVLSALNAAFDISYRSAIVLDGEISGTYAGSLRRVISRVLDGYNYVIEQNDAKLDVIILGRRGDRAVPVAMPVDPFHPLRERRRPRLLGTDSRHG